MIDFFIWVLLIALASAFLLTLARKWEIISWLQLHGSETINKMANCNFCLSWWVGVLLSVGIAIATKDCLFLIVPFFSTPITRLIL